MNGPTPPLSECRRCGGALRLLAACLLLALAACATRPPEGPPAAGSWEEHRARVQALESWRLQGRLNVQGPQQNDTIGLSWTQQGENFDINMSGRLGLGSVRIRGNETGVVVEKAGEEPLYAPTLEDISADYLGYEFPAGKLYYWVRGIPAPGSSAGVTLNDGRRLAELDSEGWELDFDRYAQAGTLVLPGRIRLAQPPWRLTFLIDEWEPDVRP